MQKLTDTIHQFAITISDHGNAAVSKGLQWFGVSGSSVGVASGVAKMSETSESVMSMSDWGAIVGIIGGATLIIKNGVDIYFAHQRNKRERESHERINNR